jgi:hypothetical protein
MTGTCCCVKSGDDLKKTRSCDSTPARTLDCVEKEEIKKINITCRFRLRRRTYYDCCCLVGQELVPRDALSPLSHCSVLFFKKSASIEGIWMQGLNPDESRIDASPRIVGSTNWCLDRRHDARKDEDW